MSSITTWQRLEPIPRSDDLRPGLRAEIADPLWLLARQRQFGELRGEDAGSPVIATLVANTAPVSRLHLGHPRGGAADAAIDYSVEHEPLEALVERERIVGTDVDGQLVVSAGLHFLRLLRHERASGVIADYLAEYALREIDLPGDDAAAARLRRRSVGRVPDARRLADDLLRHRGSAAELTSLPSRPAISAADRPKALAAANAFLSAWEAHLSEPGDDEPTAWQPNRLEHTFALQAELEDGRVTLRSDEYRGGRLDWYDFVAAGQPSLGAPAQAVAPTTLTRTVLPTPVSYCGMPADRFWEVEDGTVRFGGLDTGRTDLARLILAEFALIFGNDWFVVPIDLPVGSVTAVAAFTVVDSFGIESRIARSVSSSTQPFRMFELDAPAGPRRVQQLFFLSPTIAEVDESPPTEHVVLFRDEMANLVWGVERIYQGGAGAPVERFEEHQRQLGEQQQIDTEFGDAQLLYRLQTDVPDHWHPFVPVRAAGVSPTAGVIQLERRPLVRVLPDGTSIPIQPKGRILTADDPLRLEEEEVPRSGTEVVRTFQLARWSDGRYHLWSGRHRTTGAGEGLSNFRADVVLPVTT
jgi:hypothetical protein